MKFFLHGFIIYLLVSEDDISSTVSEVGSEQSPERESSVSVPTVAQNVEVITSHYMPHLQSAGPSGDNENSTTVGTDEDDQVDPNEFHFNFSTPPPLFVQSPEIEPPPKRSKNQ